MADMKLSAQVAKYQPVTTPGQSCHNCLYRSGSTCAKVNVVPDPQWVCRTWLPATLVPTQHNAQ